MPPTHRGGLPVKRKLRCYCGEFGFLVAWSLGLDGGRSLWAALPAWPLSQFQFSHCQIRGHTSSARVHSDGRWQRLVRSGEPANMAWHPALGSAAAGASPVTAATAARGKALLQRPLLLRVAGIKEHVLQAAAVLENGAHALPLQAGTGGGRERVQSSTLGRACAEVLPGMLVAGLEQNAS